MDHQRCITHVVRAGDVRRELSGRAGESADGIWEYHVGMCGFGTGSDDGVGGVVEGGGYGGCREGKCVGGSGGAEGGMNGDWDGMEWGERREGRVW